MDRTCIRPMVLTLALALPVAAAATDLAAGAPERYTVQRGDTLWGIAGRFLREPWRWPEVWQRNPQVHNPDLIYPGDVLALEYVEGRPVIRAERRPPGRAVRAGVVRLSPEVREVRQERAVPTIPIDAVGPFITESRVVTDGELEQAPYIVAAGREHLVAASGQTIYAGRMPASPAPRYGVYRRGNVYRAPATDEVLGYEAVFVADAVLERTGDPASLFVTRSSREIQPGDKLLPLEENLLRESFLPRAPDRDLRGTIIAVLDGVTQIGQYQVVVVDLGLADGLAPGHVLAIQQRGEWVNDPDPNVQLFPEPEPRSDFPHSFDTDLDILMSRVGNAFAPAFAGPPTVQLPDRAAGIVMVLRPFERLSYALVMEATGPIHVEDAVTTP